MSPEQAQGKLLDTRSDIFSFGAVLYEMVSGGRAFEGSSMVDVLSAIVRDEPRPLRGSPEIARIVTQCLRKMPSERFQSMAEIKAALESVVASPRKQEPSIAVLPFVNMSGDKDQEYFSDGLAEEIINALAQLPGLKVTARTSAFAFRGKEQDIRKIAEALDVHSILEGGVRRAGNRLRVTAQLINAQDGYHLWSQRYDRELADVFEVQEEIAAAIAGALQVKLAPKSEAAVRYKPNLPAYEAFLKGRHHWSKLTEDSLERSRKCYEQAVALDPRFALARNALAEHYFAMTASGFMPSREAIPQVRGGAEAASQIDPTLAEPHALLGILAATIEYDWPEAEQQFSLAMVREPVAPYVRWLYGQYLMTIGRSGEAIVEMERALQEDPLHALCRSHLAACLYAAGRHSDAFKQVGQVLEIDENFWIAHWYLSRFSLTEGNLAEARTSAERVYSLRSPNTLGTGLLAGLLAREGEAARAEALLALLPPPETYGVPMAWVSYCLAQLRIDDAAEWVERAIEQRDPRVTYVLADLRTSTHWPALARKLGLPGS